MRRPWIDGEGDFDEFVERRRVVGGAEGARIFRAIEGFQRVASFEHAAATWTEHVPGNVEETDAGAMHERADHRLFAEFMAGGEGKRISYG